MGILLSKLSGSHSRLLLPMPGTKPWIVTASSGPRRLWVCRQATQAVAMYARPMPSRNVWLLQIKLTIPMPQTSTIKRNLMRPRTCMLLTPFLTPITNMSCGGARIEKVGSGWIKRRRRWYSCRTGIRRRKSTMRCTFRGVVWVKTPVWASTTFKCLSV